MSTATCCAPTVVSLRRPLLQRWWLDARDDLLDAWKAWQQYRRLQADLRTLRALDGATLRDLGLEHLVPPNPVTLTLLDRDIGRW